jgi:hypothetical protein
MLHVDPQAASIKDMTDAIAADFAHAKAKPSPGDVKVKLTAAAELCVKERTVADGFDDYAAKRAATEKYLAAYLTGGGVSPPPAPAGVAGWTAMTDSAEKWCNAIRVSNKLWADGSAANKLAIGERVYHEAYEGAWVSYDLAARRKGTTGCQCRAPGEWFSELYAASHCKKLKDSHPAAGWLAAL